MKLKKPNTAAGTSGRRYPTGPQQQLYFEKAQLLQRIPAQQKQVRGQGVRESPPAAMNKAAVQKPKQSQYRRINQLQVLSLAHEDQQHKEDMRDTTRLKPQNEVSTTTQPLTSAHSRNTPRDLLNTREGDETLLESGEPTYTHA